MRPPDHAAGGMLVIRCVPSLILRLVRQVRPHARTRSPLPDRAYGRNGLDSGITRQFISRLSSGSRAVCRSPEQEWSLRMGETISVRGRTIDLASVYAEMSRRARRTDDGRTIFDGGLKYLLAEMFDLHADSGTPTQPLLDIRRETVVALRRMGWVADGGKNNGRYDLLR